MRIIESSEIRGVRPDLLILLRGERNDLADEWQMLPFGRT